MDKVNIEKFTSPTLIHGKKFVDDRGSLTFLNDLALNQFKRFYIVQNHRQGFIRAWHGHLKESKLFFPLEGTFQVGVAKLDSKAQPDKAVEAMSYVLDSSAPSGLFIPAGFANGSKSLTPAAKILILSTTTLEESKEDDFRLNYNEWNIWEENFR